MEFASIENGVWGTDINTHICRDGGTAALYTQGVDLEIIQRWDRRKSATFRANLRHDASELGGLSRKIAKSWGLNGLLKFVTKMGIVSLNSDLDKVNRKPMFLCARKSLQPKRTTPGRRNFPTSKRSEWEAAAMDQTAKRIKKESQEMSTSGK